MHGCQTAPYILKQKKGKGGGVGDNEVLKAVICVHSLAHLSAIDRGATKGNTLL